VDVLGGWGALDRRLVVGGVADSVAVVTDFDTLDLIAAAAPAADAVWWSVLPVPPQPGQINTSTALTVPVPSHLEQMFTR
jgi:hypothetical protein